MKQLLNKLAAIALMLTVLGVFVVPSIILPPGT